MTQKISIGKLDRARADLKHHGIFVSELQIDEFRVNAKNFFDENSEIVFGIKFQELSLIDLIAFIDVKQTLINAKMLLDEDNIEKANGY